VAQIFHNIGPLLLMLVLLACSAFFSGAETAFFSLSRKQLERFARSRHTLARLAATLRSKPTRLLGCLLFGNMAVNTLFFAVSSVLVLKVQKQASVTAAAMTVLTTFVLLLLLGEILPKSLAYANSKVASVAAAAPTFLLIEILRPLLWVFRSLIVEPALRLILGPTRGPRPVTASEFRSLVDKMNKRGLLTSYENKLLTEIIELGFLKVRHVMRPRVDMVACDVTESRETILKKMRKHGLTKIPVYVRTKDQIVGIVTMRQLLLRPQTSCDKLVQQVDFVPEQKTVESLLEHFRQNGTDIAIVVDEYGGIAGSVFLEDIAAELLGPIETSQVAPSVEQVGPFEYRLAGDLSIHDWREVFGIDPGRTHIATVGGLVVCLLGRIPKVGDVVHLKNLKFTVERVSRHRIETLILTLEPISNDG